MIISYLFSKRERKEEALTKIAKRLMLEARKKGFKTEMNSEKADLFHVLSSGFKDILKFRNKKPLLFSYFIYPKTSYLSFLKSQLELFLFRDKKQDHRNIIGRIKFFLISSFSYFIPFFIKRKTIERADLVIVPLNCIKKLFGKKKCKVIKIGINTKKFRKKKIKKDKNIEVAYVGHNASIKGIKDVIKAFGLLKNEKNIKFSIYLSDFSEKTKRYAEKLNPKIRVYGHTKDIVSIYNKIDILVLPFRSENAGIASPLVLLEGMACEKAIITTNLINLREVCGSSVLYVKPFSPKEIAEKIIFLKKNKKIREELGKKARKRILRFHNEKEMIKSYLNLYASF